MLLPATSVEYERGFSLLNRIKSVDHNKLHQENLESLMRISSTEMDVMTLVREHSTELIKRWK